jgi:hypothetical protein
MTKLSAPMAVLAGVVGLLVLADIAFAAVLVSNRSSAPPAASAQQHPGTASHPCNHGYYVSQAAHAKHSGQDVSKVAHSSAGKSGSCTKA